MKRRLPGELGEIAALPGLGPKRVKLLYDRLRVRTLADLKRAVDVGAVVAAAEHAGLARRVARLKPLICVKG